MVDDTLSEGDIKSKQLESKLSEIWIVEYFEYLILRACFEWRQVDIFWKIVWFLYFDTILNRVEPVFARSHAFWGGKLVMTLKSYQYYEDTTVVIIPT